ncbi:Tok1p [Nakaseomyces bracarensis]|uniref:Tok1p n=1 Tax=Nakaseomyces bracarensis TaxID=273131 RepID=UPI003871B15D
MTNDLKSSASTTTKTSFNSEIVRLERIFTHHRIRHDQVLKEALQFSNERVTIINADVASKSFGFWFIISCYFPVITACLGPVANTISIACAVEKWRVNHYHTASGIVRDRVNDPKGVFAVNILSLVIGCVSNAVLFLHFARKLSYMTSQIINITGWTAAGTMLMIDVIVMSAREVNHSYQEKTIGFWYAVITSGLYLCCTLTLSLHFVGHKLHKYPATFNLLPNERSIMIFTVILSIWLIWGAGMFSGLLHISYGNALYFCVVSLLTVGLGDIIPQSTVAKCMALFFSMTGVLILGIIVFMTRSIIQTSAGPIFFFHRVEKQRSKAWDKFTSNEDNFTDEECFDIMMNIRKKAKLKGHLYSLLWTVTIFIIFWILGATVFFFTENWTYFNAVYFCFLCLLTIGYGDYAPKTGAGRAFFVLWAIGAVPLMGAILSTVGDLLYATSETLDIKIGHLFKNSVTTVLIAPPVHIGKALTTNKIKVDGSEDAPDMGPKSSTDIISENDNDIGIIESRGLDDGFENSVTNDLQPEDIHIIAGITNQMDEESQATGVKMHRKSSLRRRNSMLPGRNNSVRSADNEEENELAKQEIFHGTNLFGPIPTTIEKLRRVNELLTVVKRLHELSLNDKDRKLNYNDWDKIHRLTLKNFDEDCINPDKTFWLSEYSPLKFPLNQPHYAFMRIVALIDRVLNELTVEESVKRQQATEPVPEDFMINPFNILPTASQSTFEGSLISSSGSICAVPFSSSEETFSGPGSNTETFTSSSGSTNSAHIGGSYINRSASANSFHPYVHSSSDTQENTPEKANSSDSKSDGE